MGGTGGMAKAPDDEAERLVAIGAVERETGIAKERLRIWERRYGFPRPARSAGGERLYDAAGLARLRLVKQLVDRGYRPGDVIERSEPELRALADALAAEAVAVDRAIEPALALVREHR